VTNPSQGRTGFPQFVGIFEGPAMKPHTQRSGAVTISTRQKRIRYAMLTHLTVACAVGPATNPESMEFHTALSMVPRRVEPSPANLQTNPVPRKWCVRTAMSAVKSIPSE